MPSSTPPRAVQVTPLQLVFMNHEAPPSIAIDIQSWVRFGSGQLAISLERWTMPTLPAISRKLEMGGLWSVISAVVVACITSAPAQAQSVNRTASGQPIQIFVSGCMSMSGRTARQVRSHRYS